MPDKLSARLLDCVNALPLREGIRVLEIGCGPGVAAREIARRIGDGFVLGIDRSAKAITQATKTSAAEIATGRVKFLHVAIEKFEWGDDEPLFDLAVAIRVGALDGRHPEIEDMALRNIAKALSLSGKLYIDGGNPLKEVAVKRYR